MARLRKCLSWSARALCASVLVARFAFADDLALARKAFSEGVDAFKRGDYALASTRFRDADKLHHDASITYNIGRSLERQDQLGEAVSAYERYLGEAGEKGEFAPAAALAIAQIKSRSARVSISTMPAGARVYINGQVLADRTPTETLLRSGRHVVTVESDVGRATQEIEVEGGKPIRVELPIHSSQNDSNPPPLATDPAPQKPITPVEPVHTSAPENGMRDLTGFVFGGSFTVVPYFFLKADSGPQAISASGAQVGLFGEFGYAFTERAAVLVRGMFSFGSECKFVFDSHIGGIGPAISVRLSERLWIGATALGGNAETCRRDVRLSTDLVFSPVLDLHYAVTTRKYGQWLIGANFGFFFANPSNDNSAAYLPVSFGPRFF